MKTYAKIILFIAAYFVFLLNPMDLFAPPSNYIIRANGEFLWEKMKIDKLEKENEKAIHALGMYESRMNAKAYNSIGAMGCWQFMPNTIKYFGYKGITLQKFKRDPEIFPKSLQEKLINLKINDDIKQLKNQWWRPDSRDVDYIEKYVGKEFKGVKVTLFGILAACHISGYGNVVKLFDNGYNPKDINGQSPLKYLKRFSKYKFTDPKVINASLEKLEYERSMKLAKLFVLPKKNDNFIENWYYLKFQTMIRQAKKDFDILVEKNNLEVYTKEEAAELLTKKFKAFQDLEKSEDAKSVDALNEFRAEASCFTHVQVISERDDAFDKSLDYKNVYVRPQVFVKKEEEIIEKSENGEETPKTVEVGVYTECPLNEALGRVGQKFDL